MTYTVKHTYVDESLDSEITTDGPLSTVSCSASGSLALRFPGNLQVTAWAKYVLLHEPDGSGGHSGNGVQAAGLAQIIPIPVTFQLRTPDGALFTATQVTLNDLQRFRDVRGSTQGVWTYSVEGHSDGVDTRLHSDNEISAVYSRVAIIVEELVPSESAAPLVMDRLSARDERRYAFDLYRVGTFVATAKPDSFLASLAAQRTMTLFDPNGAAVATSDSGSLTFPVSLETLDASRDAHGNVRLWSLEVLPAEDGPVFAETTVVATVIATTRIHTQTLKSRIDDLIGVGGRKVSIYGAIQEQEQLLLARLEILDTDSAATIDMHHLLDSVLKRVEQDPGVDLSEIKANVPYIVGSRSRDLGDDLHVSLYGLKVDTINVDIGASQHLQPSIPALKLDLAVEGNATIKIGGFPIATVAVTNNRVGLEAGVRLQADGTFAPDVWINDNPLDVHISWEAAVAAGVVSLGLLSVGLEGLTEIIATVFNAGLVQRSREFVAGVMGQAPGIIATILGGAFTYRSLGMDGDDIVFDYVAPLEPDPRPAPNYLGVMGRSAFQEGPHIWRIMPPSLGDTWSAQNLSKIDHIVVVMMENRAFDHVLGYRAQLPGAQNADGLTTDLLAFLGANGYPIGRLNTSGIVANTRGLKTKFPVSVSHQSADVAQQLSAELTTSTGRTILSPKGFVDNFKAAAPITAEDVLGYYVGDDLAFTRFMADNYAYCQRSFCSHPGPTLPNRMYSLSGDLQHDRTGEAIIDNNNGDNFVLSRALSIFDVLTRKRIGWRVYESFPSVTMLRMFARYATDDTNIVPLSRLQSDVAAGNLPAVTAIEPAMHSAPENDDHPIADMYNGQLFLKFVYDTLRSNSALWEKTMLIVTYDEHGGFYDHVLPPIAEVRTAPNGGVIGGGLLAPAAAAASALVTNYGLRVPTFVVSPWAPAGKGPDIVLDHCSILKTILARFCGESRPFISDRVDASRTFDVYLSESSPRLHVPPSPVLAPLSSASAPHRGSIDTAPITRKKMLTEGADFHDLSGMLARMLGR